VVEVAAAGGLVEVAAAGAVVLTGGPVAATGGAAVAVRLGSETGGRTGSAEQNQPIIWAPEQVSVPDDESKLLPTRENGPNAEEPEMA
jgi:hypothetical protein